MAVPNIITQGRYSILKVPTIDGSKFLYYLLDNNTKKLSGFKNESSLLPYAQKYGLVSPTVESEYAFQSDVFDPAEVTGANTISPEQLSNLLTAQDDNGNLIYRIDQKSYIDEDGTFIDKNYDVKLDGLKSQYGNTTTDVEGYTKNAQETVALLKNLAFRGAKYGTQQSYGLSPQFVQQFIEDVQGGDKDAANLLNKLVLSQTYGGYGKEDVIRELVRQQIVTTGENTAEISKMKGIEMISNTKNAEDIHNSEEYKQYLSNGVFTLPGSEILNTALYKAPEEYFQMPEVVKNENIWKNVESAMAKMIDLQDSMLKANSQQELDVAKGNWNRTRQQINEALGISLNDNIETAWGEISQLANSASDADLLNSGIHREALDNLLSKKQKDYARLRKSAQDQEATNDKQYYLMDATMDEILALAQTEEGRAKLKEWGLEQTDIDKKGMQDIEALKQEIQNNPEYSDAQKRMYLEEINKIAGYFGRDGYRPSQRERELMGNVQERYSTLVNEIYKNTVNEANNEEVKKWQNMYNNLAKSLENASKENIEKDYNAIYGDNAEGQKSQIDDVAPFSDEDKYKTGVDQQKQQSSNVTELKSVYDKLGGETSFQTLINKYKNVSANKVSGLNELTQDQKNLLYASKQYNWTPATDKVTTWNKTVDPVAIKAKITNQLANNNINQTKPKVDTSLDAFMNSGEKGVTYGDWVNKQTNTSTQSQPQSQPQTPQPQPQSQPQTQQPQTQQQSSAPKWDWESYDNAMVSSGKAPTTSVAPSNPPTTTVVSPTPTYTPQEQKNIDYWKSLGF